MESIFSAPAGIGLGFNGLGSPAAAANGGPPNCDTPFSPGGGYQGQAALMLRAASELALHTRSMMSSPMGVALGGAHGRPAGSMPGALHRSMGLAERPAHPPLLTSQLSGRSGHHTDATSVTGSSVAGRSHVTELGALLSPNPVGMRVVRRSDGRAVQGLCFMPGSSVAGGQPASMQLMAVFKKQVGT